MPELQGRVSGQILTPPPFLTLLALRLLMSKRGGKGPGLLYKNRADTETVCEIKTR